MASFRASLCVGLLSILLSCATSQEPRRDSGASGSTSNASADGAPRVAAMSPCAPGFEPLASGGCLLVPSGGHAQGTLLFLHGMYDPAHPAAQLATEQRLGELARERGVPVLVLRGRAGLCDWSAEYAAWLCWPSHDGQLPDVGQLLASWGPSVRAANERLRLPRARVVLAGHSNGAHFAALIASATRFGVEGYVLVNGGAPGQRSYPADRAAPTLLIAGRDDTAQRPRMLELHSRLIDAGWPVQLVERDGGHGLTEDDLRSLVEFAASTLASRPGPLDAQK